MAIFSGMCSFHFHDFFPEDRIKPKGPELVKPSKWNAHFHSEIPFGNFGVPLKKSRFPEKISVRGDEINIPSEISGFSGMGTDGKQPMVVASILESS